MKIGIGADPYGVELKEAIKAHLVAAVSPTGIMAPPIFAVMAPLQTA